MGTGRPLCATRRVFSAPTGETSDRVLSVVGMAYVRASRDVVLRDVRDGARQSVGFIRGVSFRSLIAHKPQVLSPLFSHTRVLTRQINFIARVDPRVLGE